jgi:hypothetical protein
VLLAVVQRGARSPGPPHPSLGRSAGGDGGERGVGGDDVRLAATVAMQEIASGLVQPFYKDERGDPIAHITPRARAACPARDSGVKRTIESSGTPSRRPRN